MTALESSTSADAVGFKPARLVALDRVRGLAIALMVGDHVARLLPYGEWYRLSLGRVAMPLFFLLAGALVSRPRWRHLWVGLLGLGLPVVVPWLDSPNVLTWWAIGSAAIWAMRRWRVSLWLPLVVVLTWAANGWPLPSSGSSYQSWCLLGLMVVGAKAGPLAFAWGSRLPVKLEVLGRHPILVYVLHTLGLQALIAAGWWWV